MRWLVLAALLVGLVLWRRTSGPVVEAPRQTTKARTMSVPVCHPVAVVRREGLAGTVTDPTGAPLLARVCALAPLRPADLDVGRERFAEHSRSSVELGAPDARCTDTDELGRFELQPARGLWRIRASAPQHAPDEVVVDGQDVQAEPVTLVLAPGGAALTVVVRDEVAGAVAGALVEPSEAGVPVRTDDRGRATLWLESAEYSLSVRADGYGDEQVGSVLAPGEVVLSLTPLGLLSGRVLREGEPVANARVEVRGDGSGRFLTSGGDGRFSMSLPDGWYEVRATTDDGQASVEVGIDGGDDARIDLSLERALRISGSVADERGAPCSLGEARLEPSDPAGRASGEDYDEAISNGLFVLRGVLAGSYRLEVDCVGFVPWSGTVHLDHGRALDVTVRSGHALVGRVVDGEGAPVGGIRILARGGGSDEDDEVHEQSVFSDPRGCFTFRGLAPGHYDVTTLDSTWTVRETEVDVGPDVPAVELTIVAEHDGAVSGTVACSGCEHALPQRVVLAPVDDGARPASAGINANGRFSLRAVPGRYDVLVTSRGGLMAAPGRHEDEPVARLQVTPRGRTSLDLLVSPGTARIVGRIARAAGNAAPARVLIVPRGRAHLSALAAITPRCDADGRFEAGDLAPGRYLVIAGVARREVELDPGATATVELASEPGVRDVMIRHVDDQAPREPTDDKLDGER